MKNEKVYLWSDLPWDLALASGMRLEEIFKDLDAISDTNSDEWWLEAQKLEATAKTPIGENLWRDIYNGKLLVRKANGDPFDADPKELGFRGVNAPHFTRDEGNEWLAKNRYLLTWNPTASQQDSELPDTETPNSTGISTINTGSTQGLPASKSNTDHWILKKAALIKKHLHSWPTINRDFQDASENGLSTAAKATKHGDWLEAKALDWANQKGKILSSELHHKHAASTLWPSVVHKIKG